MELDREALLTVLPAPFRHPEPEFFGGEVECIPNQRQRSRSRRQLLGSSSLGQGEHREGGDGSCERYDKNIDRHIEQRTGAKGKFRDGESKGYITRRDVKRTGEIPSPTELVQRVTLFEARRAARGLTEARQ